MKLHFLGANRQVTGSRYCLEAAGERLLIDCGLFQERPFLGRNWEPSPLPPSSLTAVLLTHAHVDHCGLLPRLIKEGYRGPIYATSPTVELAEIVLRDAASIQTEDAAYKKRRHEKEGRHGRYPEEPLYTESDVERTLARFVGVHYGDSVPIGEAFRVRFFEAGHILGSAMIEVQVTEGDRVQTIVFSGDIGQWNKPIIRDPSFLTAGDFVVMESTYGDRNHEDAGDVETQLAAVINDTVQRGGNIVVPTFAVERSQELMFHLSRLVRARRIPSLPVYLDSPMAVDVVETFRRFSECFDEETWRMIQANESPLRFPGLRLVRTTDESKAISRTTGSSFIMSTSGMCNAGRIKHHLRANIGRPESTILFVGYQGRDTLGRLILDGKQEVRIHGREYRVKAQVRQIFGFSGHADRDGLLHWLRHFQGPRQVFLAHGDEEAAQSFSELVTRELKLSVSIPEYQSVVEL